MKVGDSNRRIADHFLYSINYEAKQLSIQLSIRERFHDNLFVIIQLIMFDVRVRPSHSPPKHLLPVPLHKPFFWIILAYHR